jgi:VRR-NUC domain-containing protein
MGIRYEDLSLKQKAMIEESAPRVEKPVPEKETRGELRLEREEQRVFSHYLSLNGYRGAVWHRTDRATGCLPGTPDFIVPISGARIFWVEFKLPGKKLSKDQEEFRRYLESVGHKLHVVFSAAQAIEIMRAL